MDDFKEIFEKYRLNIYLFILKIVNYNENLAEELTQETFYQVFISFYRFNGKCEIKTWICKIAKNTCFKYFNKNPIHISMDKINFNEKLIKNNHKSLEDYIVDKEISLLLFKSIKQLKSKYRDVLIYRVYFELPFIQIGNILKIKENTAKVLYYRGKEIIKKQWRNKYG